MKLNSLLDIYGSHADFLGVYITEAHAKDEWPMGTTVCYRQPKTLEERLGIARNFKEQRGFRWTLLVDSMLNAFNDSYSAFPERLFVIEDSRMVYVGQAGPFGFNVTEVEDWLRKKFE